VSDLKKSIDAYQIDNEYNLKLFQLVRSILIGFSIKNVIYNNEKDTIKIEKEFYY
jgi:hypothetical protein